MILERQMDGNHRYFLLAIHVQSTGISTYHKAYELHQTIFIIGDVWNTEFDTIWFFAVGIQTTEPNLTNGALAASWLLGGGPGVCFKLI